MKFVIGFFIGMAVVSILYGSGAGQASTKTGFLSYYACDEDGRYLGSRHINVRCTPAPNVQLLKNGVYSIEYVEPSGTHNWVPSASSIDLQGCE